MEKYVGAQPSSGFREVELSGGKGLGLVKADAVSLSSLYSFPTSPAACPDINLSVGFGHEGWRTRCRSALGMLSSLGLGAKLYR